jgi:hypothetical protein
MAFIQKTRFDKYKRYTIKYLTSFFKSLSPNAVTGRCSGPKILLVSIPKSGTHMLEGILESVPIMRNSGWRTITNDAFTPNVIHKIKHGMFANSHLYHSCDLVRSLADENVKTIFMIRDPRDIVISRYKYICDIDYLHPAHTYFSNLQSNEDRLTASIQGVENLVPSIKSVLDDFKGWIYESDVLTVRFEELVGSRGHGSDDMREHKLNEIFKFAGLNIDKGRIRHIDEQLRDKDSSTRRRGIVGGWKEEFTDYHTELFENNLQDLMEEYGYK